MANKKVDNKKNVTKTKSTNRINSGKVKREYKKKEKVVEEEVIKVVENERGNSSSTFNLIEVIIIMVITAVFGILIGTCVAYFKEHVVDDNNIPDELRELVDVYYEISDEYYNEIDKKALVEAGIEGMVKHLGDPFSTYLDYGETQSLNEELEGEFVGMGATVSSNDNNQIYIYDLFEDSPAAKAGFEIGDIIIKVDDKSIENMTTEEVSYLIKGEEGTKVDITILRNGEEKALTLTRGKIVLTSVTYKMLDETNIGYINISLFAKNSGKQFENAMDELIKLGAEAFIIDVRGNSGGYLTTAEEISSMFLKKNDVMYQLDTKGIIEYVKADKNGKYKNANVIVLTNNGSASASEMLAATLKENIDAKIVGEKTYGKGTVQKTKTLSSGTMIKYTIQEWYTPKGNKVNGVGVEPTHFVTLSDDFYNNPLEANDNQLQEAINLLK
ncbi:MAG: S41 family peptidase [Bacilli bacterium]|nr:S41 family peptidase [Bacilli bacterium]